MAFDFKNCFYALSDFGVAVSKPIQHDIQLITETHKTIAWLVYFVSFEFGQSARGQGGAARKREPNEIK